MTARTPRPEIRRPDVSLGAWRIVDQVRSDVAERAAWDALPCAATRQPRTVCDVPAALLTTTPTTETS